jgi:hypothetical protein
MKRLQKIYQIRPVELKYYTYNGERIRNVPDDYMVDELSTVQESLYTLRSYRNNLLALCDWTQINDVPLSEEQKNDWRVYRQLLRDFPETVNTTNWSASSWPLAPGEIENIAEETIFDYPPEQTVEEKTDIVEKVETISEVIPETTEETVLSIIDEFETIIVNENDLQFGTNVEPKNSREVKQQYIPAIISYEYSEEMGTIPILGYTQSESSQNTQ